MRHLSEEEKQRRQKLIDLRGKGINPYRNGLTPSYTANDIRRGYGHMTREQFEKQKVNVSIAGRIMAFRHFGKASFLSVKDRSGQIQSYIARDDIGQDEFKTFKTFDVGDFVYISGYLFRTKTDELSIRADKCELLTKSLRPLPEKFHGLTDVEQKYRMRYVDLIMNDETKKVFLKRSHIIRFIRDFLNSRDYLEVETPMMHPLVGGAAARPFKTHHNTLDMDLYLRIAPELYLKRLLVGGIERVYEINRNFRNEGISIRHNPEFTMLEFYQAYATYEDLIDLTEEMLHEMVMALEGKNTISYQGEEISFARPFARYTMKEAVRELGGLPAEFTTDEALVDAEMLRKALKHCQVDDKDIAKQRTRGHLLERLFEEVAETKLIQPTFITGYPTETSFLSRKNEQDPRFVDRFEFFIYGREIGNAFSELNDPIDQLERFEVQAKAKEDGDDEACDVDMDYIRALEYGMPPAAGEGIGIDRLAMLLTDSASIRDVIMFPHMRPELDA